MNRKPSSGGFGPVALAAILSGAAGLVYEVGWARAFALRLGGQVPVLTGLLATFLGGLALGAWIGGRRSSHSPRPLRLFVLLELGTAAAGALVLPALELASPLFEALYRRHLESGAPFLLPAVTLAGLTVLPAAVLMGATLPALVEHFRRLGQGAGRSAGILYGANTAGAVSGALGAGLLALPSLGLQRTLLLAAAGNVAAALVAAWLARSPDLPARAPAATPPKGPPRPAAGAALLLAVLIAGTASMVDQVAWTRVLSMLLGSTVYGFSLILAAFLSGLALGGLAGARLCSRFRNQVLLLGTLYVGVGASCLLALGVLGRLPVWIVPPLARAQAGIGWVLSLQFAAAFAVVVLPTFLMGAAYPVAVALRAGSSRPAGAAAGEIYAASSAGLVVGSVLAGTWLLPALGVHLGLMTAALVMPLVAVLVATSWRGTERRGATRLAVAGTAAVAGLALALPRWDVALVTSGPFLYAPLYRASASAQAVSIADAIRGRGEVLFHREGADATVSVRRSPTGSLSLQINGKTDASTGGDMVSQLLAGHLPALLGHREGGSALLIGLATGVSLGALETYPYHRIDTVEILPEVAEAAGWFAAANRDALGDGRLDLLLGDGRSHLLYSGRTYDVITSQPTNPWVAGAAALFTRETFLAARQRLRNGGVFCQWIQGYGMPPEELRSVVATFLEAFPDTSLWEDSPAGGDFFLLGRKGAPATLELPLLEERMRRPGPRQDLARAGILDPPDFLSHFVAGPQALARLASGAKIQAADRATLEFTAARALYSDTLPQVVEALRRHRESPAPLLDGLDRTADPGGLLARLRAARARARREERLLLSVGGSGASALVHPELAIGVDLLRAGLPEQASRHLERAAAGPAAAEALALLGALHASAGRPDLAARELARSLLLRPEDLASRALLARLHLEAGRLEDAAVELGRARQRDPEDPDLLLLDGVLALLQDEPARAARLLEQAVERDADLPEAWTNLGVARRQSGDLAGALEAYRRALELDAEIPDARFNLGVGLLLAGDPEGAVRELARVVLTDPADAAARLQLAEAYRRRSQPDHARRELQGILDWAPDSPEAERARQALAGL
jgi:spermidine synthase